jgi:hypothetical protein
MRNPRRLLSVLPRPWSVLDGSLDSPNAALEYEIAQEKAASLGRSGRRLEAALAALRAFDAAHARAHRSGERERLLDEAGTLLWHLVVQREACGLRDSARVMQDYGVPRDVRARMGISRRRTEQGRQTTEHR